MSLHLLGISRTADVRRWGDGCTSAGHNDATVQAISAEGADADLDDERVRWVAHDDLSAAVVSPLPPSTGPLRHAALQMMIHRHGDLLPLRFGVVLPGEIEVRALLRRRRDRLLHDLDRLKGTSEIGLRIVLSQSSLLPNRPELDSLRELESPTARYLAARRARYQRQDQLDEDAQRTAETCVQAVKGLYRSWKRLAPEPLGTIRLAFLVERDFSGAFVERVEGLKAGKIGPQCTLVGPWPPYSFV